MTHRCVCGAVYGPSALVALPVVQVLAARELDGIVLRWPPERVVEVRGCTCGRPIARLAERTTRTALTETQPR